MARIRTIKPEIVEDEKTAALSDSAFRLFASMIFLADDHGNVRADSRWLQGQIWWAHREPPRTAAILREVSEAGLITVYEVRGGIYAHLLGWGKHQRIDNAGKPRVPLLTDVDSTVFQFERAPEGAASRNSAANRGEIPLDPDPDPDPERDHEGDPELASPPAPPDSSGLAALKSKVNDAAGDVGKRRATKPPRPRKPPTPGHAEAREHWTAYWSRRTGQHPTWGAKHATLLNGLINAHGLDEVRRRIDLLEASRDNWIRGWDFAAFASHSDRLVSGASLNGPRDLRAGDLLELQLQRIAASEAAEREGAE